VEGGGVEWLLRKADVLIAAVFVAAAAVGASQGHAFMTQYEERLARDLGQARARVSEIRTGLRYKLMSDVVRGDLEAAAQTRFDRLNIAYSAIAGAGVTKPYALARYREPRLVAETEGAFVPRLPRDTAGVLYTVLGALLGFLAYEIVKFPVVLSARPRQRKFRRRG
jgi:hypothetical protein